MTEWKSVRIGCAMTGSFCTFRKVFQAWQALAETGAALTPIMSQAAHESDTRFYPAAEARRPAKGRKAEPAEEEQQHVYCAGGLMMNDDLKEVTVDDNPVKLTPIEYNILLLLVKNQGKVFSINQIYESIWNEEAIGADNTVAVHIRHIREKIEINPKEPRYLKVVWGVGYKIEKDLSH